MTQREPTDEEVKAAARRSVAYSLLPSIIKALPEVLGKVSGAKSIVKKAYALADEMIEQGE